MLFLCYQCISFFFPPHVLFFFFSFTCYILHKYAWIRLFSVHTGNAFVSTVEHNELPLYASQWHPEKNSFEFAVNHDGTPVEVIRHTQEAVQAGVCVCLLCVCVEFIRQAVQAGMCVCVYVCVSVCVEVIRHTYAGICVCASVCRRYQTHTGGGASRFVCVCVCVCV